MGRGKIEIKKIENANSRQVTFSKRRAGLLKKAHELAVLCDADVAVVIFSNTGKLFEYASSSMKRILSRYNKCLDSAQAPALECKQEKQEPEEVDVLKREITSLKQKQLRLLGRDLAGVGLQELQALEQQLNEGLICIKEKKEQILMQELSHYKMKEQKTAQDNEDLRRQVEVLQGVIPISSHPPLCLDYHKTGMTSPVLKEVPGSPDTAYDVGPGGHADEEHSDTTLHLGLPHVVCKKRKTPDGEPQSSNSGTQLGPR